MDTDREGEHLGYHNGGSIFLGLDGELFIALGDGAGRGRGEAADNARDLTTLRGKLARIIPTASGDEPYGTRETAASWTRTAKPRWLPRASGDLLPHSHNGGSGAVIGGAVYRGSAIPALRGTYFFSDLCGGTRGFRYDGESDTIVIDGDGSVEEQTNAEQTQQTLVSIQNGGDGELYFVGRGGSTNPNDPPTFDSVIYKLEAYVP